MPGIGHLVYGLAVVAGLLYLSRNTFNHKVAFIYFVNNYLGPDAAHVYWNWGHSLLGFAIFAIPLSLFYSYMSRFSLRKTERFVDLVDDGKREVNWKNAFYATVAGGISHRMIDFLFHGGHHQGLSPWFDLTLDDMVSWAPAGGGLGPWIVLDMALIIFAIVGGWYALRDGSTKAVKFLCIVAGVFLLAAAVSLLEVTGGESDLGVIFFAFLYVLAPLLLVGHASREVADHPVEQVARPRIDRRILVPLLMALQMAVVGLFFAAAIAAIFWTSWFEALIDTSFGGPAGTITVGILFLGLTGVGLVACIGVLFTNNICRKIVIVISAFAWYLVIPFGVALVLSEKDVKQKFLRGDTSVT